MKRRLTPLKPRKRGADLGALHAEVARDGDGGQGIRDIVVARHRQGAALDHLPLGLQRDANCAAPPL